MQAKRSEQVRGPRSFLLLASALHQSLADCERHHLQDRHRPGWIQSGAVFSIRLSRRVLFTATFKQDPYSLGPPDLRGHLCEIPQPAPLSSPQLSSTDACT
ncbi:hypothetical protein DPEC_G00253840 [Dallia pectoralis]|uniref:Uncharacterized protein n=1 Tax=Dallia pectoralis TaxID=75939 RepID=A0ACC2FUF6_DALPE|nr:hypothetical protein DPEC_G00253840 [Dallia pectoralis]